MEWIDWLIDRLIDGTPFKSRIVQTDSRPHNMTLFAVVPLLPLPSLLQCSVFLSRLLEFSSFRDQSRPLPRRLRGDRGWMDVER